MVWSPDHGDHYVDDVGWLLEEAVANIESALEESPIEPFFGSGSDFECRLVAEVAGSSRIGLAAGANPGGNVELGPG